MILQQDDANAINLSQCWESLERLIEATTIEEKKATEFAVFAKSLSSFSCFYCAHILIKISQDVTPRKLNRLEYTS